MMQSVYLPGQTLLKEEIYFYRLLEEISSGGNITELRIRKEKGRTSGKCVCHEINKVTEGGPAKVCDHVSGKIQLCCPGFTFKK